MAIPKSVEEQGKAADKLHKEIYAPEKKGDKGTPPKVEKLEKAPEIEKVVPPAKEKEPVHVEPAIPDRETEVLRQQHIVLQGKYDAEVPALHEQVGNLTEEIKRLKESHNSPPSDSAPDNFDEAVKAMESQYGAEFISFVDRKTESKATEIATRIVNEKMQDVDKRMGSVEDNVDLVVNNQAQTEKERFENALKDGLGKDWRTGVNRDAGLNVWLNTPIDAELGDETYRDKLNTAVASLDDITVLNIFNRYKQIDPAALSEKKTKEELEALVVADGQGGGGDTLDGDGSKKIYSRADITRHYRDVNDGKYKNNPAEATRIDIDIVAAGNEGRITD